MREGILGFIDETTDYIEENMEEIKNASLVLWEFFTELFKGEDCFLNTSHRIKSHNSLKEKIIRNNYYIKYKSSENLLTHLKDLIGVRIECRFIADEKCIYERLLSHFSSQAPNQYFTSDLNPKIFLNLNEEQPKYQKNGFQIYRINGFYQVENFKFNFELQIKSLVNLFWGEIDHRILYKNYNYMLTEDIIRDIMYSIKQNLTTIDAQLEVVYNQMVTNDTTDNRSINPYLKSIISKFIHDLFVVKLKDGTGLILDFRKQTNLIVDYIYAKVQYSENQDYSGNFLRLISRLHELNNKNISFGKYIDIGEVSIRHSDTREFAKEIKAIVNQDFVWNMIFTIIFEVENGDKQSEFVNFIEYIVYLITREIREAVNNHFKSLDDKEIVVDQLVSVTLKSLAGNHNSEDFSTENLGRIDEIIDKFSLTVEDNRFISHEEYGMFKELIEKELLG